MNRANASQSARELVKAFVENQTIPETSGPSKDRGERAAEFVIAMHKALTDYYEKSGD